MEKKILSENQMNAIADDLDKIFKKHGLSGGYLVTEIRRDAKMADFCTVITTGTMGILLDSLAKQTYGIIRTLSVSEAPKINDN